MSGAAHVFPDKPPLNVNAKILISVVPRLASLCIMGDQLRAPLKPLPTLVLWWSEGIQGVLNWSPTMPRDASLSDSYTSEGCLRVFTFLSWCSHVIHKPTQTLVTVQKYSFLTMPIFNLTFIHIEFNLNPTIKTL